MQAIGRINFKQSLKILIIDDYLSCEWALRDETANRTLGSNDKIITIANHHGTFLSEVKSFRLCLVKSLEQSV